MINRIWTKSISRETMIINTDYMMMKVISAISIYIQSFCTDSTNSIVHCSDISYYSHVTFNSLVQFINAFEWMAKFQ